MRALRVLIAAVVAAAGVSCTASLPTPPPATPAPTTITLPPRPRDVPIDGVDPCTLLTAEQREGLALDGQPGNYAGQNGLLGATSDCTILGYGTPNIALGVALAPDAGIERFTRGDLLSDVMPISVEGFPAVISRPRTFDDFCAVVIDVAPGQLIGIQFGDGGGDQPPVPMDDLCRGAQRSASEVMHTLLSR